MRSTRLLMTVTLCAGLMSGCGSSSGEDPAAGTTTSAAASSTAPPSPSASASASPSVSEAAPTGTLSTKPMKCADVKLVAGLKRAGASPEVMCAFESATDYVSFRVGRQANSFEIAKITEQGNSKGKVVIEQVPADGWTFGAQWPANGPFMRVQRWLVDAKGQVLLCKMGSDRGEAGITELVSVCEQAKTALYTP